MSDFDEELVDVQLDTVRAATVRWLLRWIVFDSIDTLGFDSRPRYVDSHPLRLMDQRALIALALETASASIREAAAAAEAAGKPDDDILYLIRSHYGPQFYRVLDGCVERYLLSPAIEIAPTIGIRNVSGVLTIALVMFVRGALFARANDIKQAVAGGLLGDDTSVHGMLALLANAAREAGWWQLDRVVIAIATNLEQFNLELDLPIYLELRGGMYPLTEFDLPDDVFQNHPRLPLKLERDGLDLLPNAQDATLGASYRDIGVDREGAEALPIARRRVAASRAGSSRTPVRIVNRPYAALAIEETAFLVEHELFEQVHGRVAVVAAKTRRKIDRVDAAAFCPKRVRPGTPELLTIGVFKRGQGGQALRHARQSDQRSKRAVSRALGSIRRGDDIRIEVTTAGASLEASAATGIWDGAPRAFQFVMTPTLDPAVKQVVVEARVIIKGIQIGAVTFVRPVATAKSVTTQAPESRERMRRFKRVFLSYSSKDRDTVGGIWHSYNEVGVRCFFDRQSLTSGEEWSPRLLREIERSDLFLLCWSRNAATSEWVERETLHAMQRRRATLRKTPNIRIRMLDGPPWAAHPQTLNELNFDDYDRAALMGYARPS